MCVKLFQTVTVYIRARRKIPGGEFLSISYSDNWKEFDKCLCDDCIMSKKHYIIMLHNNIIHLNITYQIWLHDTIDIFNKQNGEAQISRCIRIRCKLLMYSLIHPQWRWINWKKGKSQNLSIPHLPHLRLILYFYTMTWNPGYHFYQNSKINIE